jgi:hypothetical protein
MTESRTTEPFETRLAQLVAAYTDVAAGRTVDPLELSRAAMSAPPVARRSATGLGGGLGRRLGDRWAIAAIAAVLFVVVAVAIQGRSSNVGIVQPSSPGVSSPPSTAASAGEAILDVLRHAWQRPIPVTPGPDLYGSGFLTLTGDLLAFGREQGAGASRTEIVAGPDSLVLTATAETQGCEGGDVGAYRWTLEGKDTVLTLTPATPDACPARDALLTGPWVRADLPSNLAGGTTLAPGTYTASAFDPLLDGGRSGRLSYTVPAGWEALGEDPAAFLLHELSDPAQGLPSGDLLIGVLAQPVMAADLPYGTDCPGPGDVLDASGVGRGRDDLVAAIRARPGVVSAEPTPVTVAGYPGLSLDLRLAPSWTGWCAEPGGGRLTGIPILHQPAAHALAGLSTEAPFLRLILLDLGNGKTLAIVIAGITTSGQASFEEQASAAMSIVDSFEIGPSSTPSPSPTA